MTISLTVLLAAIAAVETGSSKAPDLAVGAAGERSRYQISAAVWRAHAAEPGVDGADFVSAAGDRVKAEIVATARLIAITKALEAAHITVTVESLAGAWKSPERVLAGHWSAETRDYARRVRNLYDDAAARTGTGTGKFNHRGTEGTEVGAEEGRNKNVGNGGRQ